MRAPWIRTAAALSLALALVGCPRERPRGGAPAGSASAAPSALAARPAPPPPGLDGPVPRVDAALPKIAVDGLPALGTFTTLALAPSGATIENEAVVASWPEADRARVLKDMPPGTTSVVEPRHKVLGLHGWRLLAEYDGGVGEALGPLRDALSRLAMLELVHRRPDATSASAPRLDLAIYVAETMPFDLLTRVLMVAQVAGYQDFHFAVRDAKGAVRDLAVLAPAFDFEVLRTSRGGYCTVPLVTKGPRGFDVSVALGAVGADVVAQPQPFDLKRIDAERDFIRRAGDHATDAPHIRPPGPAPSGSAAAEPEPAWARWFRRPVLRADRACPSVPNRGDAPDVESLLALARQVHAIAPGCRSAFLRTGEDTPFGEVAPLLASLATVAPRVVLLAPGAPHDDCADAVPVAELSKAAR